MRDTRAIYWDGHPNTGVAPIFRAERMVGDGRRKAWADAGRVVVGHMEPTTMLLELLAVLGLFAVAMPGAFETAAEFVGRYFMVLTGMILCAHYCNAKNYTRTAWFGALALLYNPAAPAFGFSGIWALALGAFSVAATLMLWGRSRAAWMPLPGLRATETLASP